VPRKRCRIAAFKWTSHDSTHRLSVLVVFGEHAERTLLHQFEGDEVVPWERLFA